MVISKVKTTTVGLLLSLMFFAQGVQAARLSATGNSAQEMYRYIWIIPGVRSGRVGAAGGSDNGSGRVGAAGGSDNGIGRVGAAGGSQSNGSGRVGAAGGSQSNGSGRISATGPSPKYGCSAVSGGYCYTGNGRINATGPKSVGDGGVSVVVPPPKYGCSAISGGYCYTGNNRISVADPIQNDNNSEIVYVEDEPSSDEELSKCEGRPYPKDIDRHWAELYIKKLYDLCIVEGYQDGYFRPEQNVTRAELVKMGLFAGGVSPNQGCYDNDCGTPFADLDKWQGKWVRPAWEKGIVEGDSSMYFSPNRPITRAETVKIVLSTYGYSPLNVNKSFFNDVSGWSTGWVERAHEIGLVQGVGNGNFDPNRPVTRAEAAKIIAKMIEYWDNTNAV